MPSSTEHRRDRARYGAVPAGLAASLIVQPAFADESHDTALAFDGSIGAGVDLFDYAAEDTLLVNGAPQVTRNRTLATSPAFSIGAMPVFALSRRVAFGVRTEVALLPSLDVGTFHSDVGGGLLVSESAVGLYRPRDTSLEIGFLLGIEVPLLTRTTSDVGTLNLIDETSCADFGPRAGFKFGIVPLSGFGVALAASGAALGICHSASFLVEGTYSSW